MTMQQLTVIFDSGERDYNVRTFCADETGRTGEYESLDEAIASRADVEEVGSRFEDTSGSKQFARVEQSASIRLICYDEYTGEAMWANEV